VAVENLLFHELIQIHETILNFKITQCRDLDLSGSRDVIGHVTILIAK